MEQDGAYDEILNRAEKQIEAHVPHVDGEKRAAPGLLVEILKQPASARLRTIATESRFQTYALVIYALERSEAVLPYQPRAALELTRLARAVTIQIDPRTCGGPEALADLGAYALAREGNVQRVCGEMTAGLTALARAREVQKLGGCDAHFEAQIDMMEASLRRDLGQLYAALSLLDRAADGFLSLGEGDLWSQAQINRSNVFQVQEDFEKAASILEDAATQAIEPHTLLCIRHNLIYLLARSGRPCEAARLMEKSRKVYRWFSQPLISSRRLWVEGLIACGLGEDELAENLLGEAGANLDEHGYAFDAALARLDLARIQTRRGGEPLYAC